MATSRRVRHVTGIGPEAVAAHSLNAEAVAPVDVMPSVRQPTTARLVPLMLLIVRRLMEMFTCPAFSKGTRLSRRAAMPDTLRHIGPSAAAAALPANSLVPQVGVQPLRAVDPVGAKVALNTAHQAVRLTPYGMRGGDPPSARLGRPDIPTLMVRGQDLPLPEKVVVAVQGQIEVPLRGRPIPLPP